MRGVVRGALILLMLGVLPPTPTLAADEIQKPPKKTLRDRMLFRFEFDNDTFIGSDDLFTAGWGVQVHSRLMDTWNHGFGWIGKIPTLGDDGAGGRIVRWSTALSQIIITPTDITIAAPQPNDAPWAGMLAATLAWSAYDNKKLGAAQLYLGCMGPCSYAEQVQTFVHKDLGFGETPEGWDNQLVNQALVNLNYTYRHKIYVSKDDHYAFGRFGHDFAGGGDVNVGNFLTSARAALEFRFGWGMPKGFTKVPDPPGIGIALDPIWFDPAQPMPSLKGWSVTFNAVVRYAWIYRLAPAEGGETKNGGFHPAIDFPDTSQAILGMHFVHVPFGLHLTYYRYFGHPIKSVPGTLDWANISLEYRF